MNIDGKKLLQIPYTTLQPGGNNTALIQLLVRNKKQRKIINDRIMQINPQIEQVGFYATNNFPILIMAGGEFCGNALRSLAYLLLKGKNGEFIFQVSGTNKLLKAGVDIIGNGYAEMPLPKNPLKKLSDNLWIVELDGITHLITRQKQLLSPAEEKSLAYLLLNQQGLLQSKPASGVMFVREYPDYSLELFPVVWVRDIKSLIDETACATGTTAVGIWKATCENLYNTSVRVKQPSGEYITANITRDRNNWSVYISGPVSIIQEREIVYL